MPLGSHLLPHHAALTSPDPALGLTETTACRSSLQDMHWPRPRCPTTSFATRRIHPKLFESHPTLQSLGLNRTDDFSTASAVAGTTLPNDRVVPSPHKTSFWSDEVLEYQLHCTCDPSYDQCSTTSTGTGVARLQTTPAVIPPCQSSFLSHYLTPCIHHSLPAPCMSLPPNFLSSPAFGPRVQHLCRRILRFILH